METWPAVFAVRKHGETISGTQPGFLFSHSVQDPSLCNDVTHASLETPSQTCLVVYLLNDHRFSQDDIQD